MASRGEVTLPATRPKSRKSLAHVPSSPSIDQENTLADFSALSSERMISKKPRSKSIGPGGLDALIDASGNRRKSITIASHPPPKSILKLTMPPLREIPAHMSTRKASPRKATPPSAAMTENLINFQIEPRNSISDTCDLPNPFEVETITAVNETRVILKTEKEQKSAAREREEKERQELEKEVIARRDARRKSLANRRVSFAPEATLHTWDVVVEYQDSTTSSNSTRRASSISGLSVGSPKRPSATPSSDPSGPPSTPPDQAEEEAAAASPAHQRDMQQNKRRRSSGIPAMNFNNPDDELFSSSPFSADSADEADIVDDASNSNSDSGDDDGTMISLDGGETTNMSMASIDSGESTSSSTRVDEALRQTAPQAGAQGIDSDEDRGFNNEKEEVLASFTPWVEKDPVTNPEAKDDQENLHPLPAAFSLNAPIKDEQSDGEEITMDITRAVGSIISEKPAEEDEMSMDVTRAFGGIIAKNTTNINSSKRESTRNRRQSTRRRLSRGDSSMEDETMELTMAIGGIKSSNHQNGRVDDENEELTMEFTSVVGGVLSEVNPSSRFSRRISMAPSHKTNRRNRETLQSTSGDETMDMTVAMGGIIPVIKDEDATVGMDMTTALGTILAPQRTTGSYSHATRVAERETDLESSTFQAGVTPNSPFKALGVMHTVTSETGSPSLAGSRSKGLRRSAESRKSTTPKSALSVGCTPTKKPGTPTKQLTPQPARPTIPGKTPPSKNIVMRTSSPKRLFKDEIKVESLTPQSAREKKLATPSKIFEHDKRTGTTTPSFILTPKPRRSSGVGLDKVGLGSPRVAALLDRRGSIGDEAGSFVPSQLVEDHQGVHFRDPRMIEYEIDQEINREEKENGRRILEQEADQAEEDRDATVNLKEMIQSLTPKKRPLSGRKSLHVGAAKGLLGKRPVELDEDNDDEDETDGVKRLKNHQGSPVKNVKLHAPPSKAETTTGRVMRAAQKSLEELTLTSVIHAASVSPEKINPTSPCNVGRFKDVESLTDVSLIVSPAKKNLVEDPQTNEDSFRDERIQLQDFLNMTSIRFMELTTTKRRHTISQKSLSKDLGKGEKHVSLEDCVAAGAATIPMLELFQHACHELKRYISEGRRTVREIESETWEENPPLFREYISATPDMKVVMDNQLKNVKTHARLLSKGQWYDWRMTLLSTLKEGLFKTAEGMIHDEEILDHQQSLLDPILPRLVQSTEKLEREKFDLEAAAEEIANCNQEELGEARQRLVTIEADVQAKKLMVAELRKQLQGKEAEISAGLERKKNLLEEISDSEKIRQECRGWASSEISVYKEKVDALEKKHGWTITGVSGTITSMTYQKEIELVFDASAFLPNQSAIVEQPANLGVDLRYIGANRELNPLSLTMEKEFFLQCIRDHIRAQPQGQTQIKNLLASVSISWNKARQVVDDIHLLSLSCPTNVSRISDSSIVVRSTLLIAPLTTKVELSFLLTNQKDNGSNAIDIQITPSAHVIYGERFNEPKMADFLLNRCGYVVAEKGQAIKSSWGDAVGELGDRLLARGRK